MALTSVCILGNGTLRLYLFLNVLWHIPVSISAIRLLSTLDLTPAWNTYDHTGVWRHIVLRHGGGLLVNLVTSSEATEEHVQYVCDQLCSLPDVRGVLWTINDGVAEVATGELKSILYGVSTLETTLREDIEIPYDGFAQVNDEGAELLMQCIAEATESSTTLFDLYCGSGGHRHRSI